MTVTSMLSALVREVDTLDPVLVENIWALAERCGDTETMISVLNRRDPLPKSVADAARSRKEAGIRVAFLSRTDLEDADRTKLLEGEKRSDVFAGLIKLAKERPELAARLYAQFQAKPTKALARVLLREGFYFEDSVWLALLTLANDKSPSQPLVHAMEQVVVANSSDPARAAKMIEVLPDHLLVAMAIERVSGENLVPLAERLQAIAIAPYDRWDYQARNRKGMAIQRLVQLASRQELPADLVTLLDVLSGNSSFDAGSEVAALLAARLACQSSEVDDREHAARTATGKTLSDFFELAATSDANHVQPVVQGLLENPKAWNHSRFEVLVSGAKPVSLIRAMRNTRSSELLAAIWAARTSSTPPECWDEVDDVEAVQLEILRQEIAGAGEKSPGYGYSSAHGRIASLLEHRSSKRLVAEIPSRMFESSGYHRWSTPVLLRSCSQHLAELQLEVLGSDSNAWENFNNLASGWSGTLGELLEAARTL